MIIFPWLFLRAQIQKMPILIFLKKTFYFSLPMNMHFCWVKLENKNLKFLLVSVSFWYECGFLIFFSFLIMCRYVFNIRIRLVGILIHLYYEIGICLRWIFFVSIVLLNAASFTNYFNNLKTYNKMCCLFKILLCALWRFVLICKIFRI